jgi:hypothetical protein
LAPVKGGDEFLRGFPVSWMASWSAVQLMLI